MTTNETRVAVLDVAQEYLQTRGYNAFSFRDLAARVQIKTASVHYHFPTKVELCRALIQRHREQLASVLATIDAAGLDATARLGRYVDLFVQTLATGNQMCPCGMLAADVATLDPEVVADLRQAFDDHEAWLAGVLADGRAAGQLSFAGSARDEAEALFAALEGAMLIARAREEPARFTSAAGRLIDRLGARPAR